jgi:hypothetical protein
MRILNPEKITCYVVDEFLGKYLIREKKLPLLLIRDKKYYFSKNEYSKKVMTEGFPIIYKFCRISKTKEEKQGV